MLVNFVGARHLIEQVLPKMPDGSAIAYVASNAGLGWQQHLGTLTGLVDTEGFHAGKAWCEEHADAIGRRAPTRSRSRSSMRGWRRRRAATWPRACASTAPTPARPIRR